MIEIDGFFTKINRSVKKLRGKFLATFPNKVYWPKSISTLTKFDQKEKPAE